MTLRNRGEPAGFAKVTAPVMAAAMRRANEKDRAVAPDGRATRRSRRTVASGSCWRR
jgi:hypothetical protein